MCPFYNSNLWPLWAANGALMTALNERVAKGLGWDHYRNPTNGEWSWRRPGGGFDDYPDFSHDFNACFGPGGPWERLKKHSDLLTLGSVGEAKIFYVVLSKGPHAKALSSGCNSECEAVCLAFLEMVSEEKGAKK